MRKLLCFVLALMQILIFVPDAFAAESISDATEFELLLALPALIADFAAFFAACAAVPELLPAVPAPVAPATGAAAPAVAIIAPLTIAVFNAFPIIEAINPAGEPGVPLRNNFI